MSDAPTRIGHGGPHCAGRTVVTSVKHTLELLQ